MTFHMAQPAVLVGEDRTDLIAVPAFRPKSKTEPLFTWESWSVQFFLAVNLREYCNANILLSEPAEVFDDQPPRPERKVESENQTEEGNHIARDEAETRKTNEINEERRKKGPKDGPNVFFHEADQRIKSRLFFSLGSEGKKRFLQSQTHIDIATISFRDFYNHCVPLFKRDKNYIIEKINLYNTQQLDRESLETFF